MLFFFHKENVLGKKKKNVFTGTSFKHTHKNTKKRKKKTLPVLYEDFLVGKNVQFLHKRVALEATGKKTVAFLLVFNLATILNLGKGEKEQLFF